MASSNIDVEMQREKLRQFMDSEFRQYEDFKYLRTYFTPQQMRRFVKSYNKDGRKKFILLLEGEDFIDGIINT